MAGRYRRIFHRDHAYDDCAHRRRLAARLAAGTARTGLAAVALRRRADTLCGGRTPLAWPRPVAGAAGARAIAADVRTQPWPLAHAGGGAGGGAAADAE